MGDVSDMIINGELCQHCGVHIGGEAGYSRSCESCESCEEDNSQEIKFTACAQLDFDDKYPNCKKEAIDVNREVKAFWMRPTINESSTMVQFCKLRGRLNYPDACLCEENKVCSRYEDKIHTVVIEN